MPTWIFLRGLTRESAHWGAFTPQFESAVPGARVIPLDLPGNGRLHRVPSPTTVRGMVECCRAELAAQGVRPPFWLLAMSLGAMVATDWAQLAPEELAGCVLINTSLQPFSPFYERLRPANYLALLCCALPGNTPHTVEQTVLQLTSRRAQIHRAAVADWVAIRRLRSVSATNALRQLLAAARYTAPTSVPTAASPARQLATPRMLLLASQNDGLVSSKCSQAIVRAWGVPLRLHPFAGHDLPLDDAQWVINQVRAWMSEPG